VTPGQRRVLVAVGLLVAAAAVALGVTVAAGGGGGGAAPPRVTARPATTRPAPSVTTSSTSTTSTSTTSTTTTTAPPGPTTTSVVGSTVTGAGAVLATPSGPTEVRRMAGGCRSLADPGFTAECGVAVVAGGERLVWLVERGPSGGMRAYVLRAVGGDRWAVVLAVLDDAGGRIARADARVLDVSGDGADEIVFGFRLHGTSEALSVDVVDGPRPVVAHRDLLHGSARVSAGQLDTWSAEFPGNEPNCCPPSFRHDVIRVRAGRWTVVSSASVPPASVPPSQLGVGGP
jgi:hypothetical protein